MRGQILSRHIAEPQDDIDAPALGMPVMQITCGKLLDWSGPNLGCHCPLISTGKPILPRIAAMSARFCCGMYISGAKRITSGNWPEICSTKRLRQKFSPRG
jgi:hypothetical protein